MKNRRVLLLHVAVPFSYFSLSENQSGLCVFVSLSVRVCVRASDCHHLDALNSIVPIVRTYYHE